MGNMMIGEAFVDAVDVLCHHRVVEKQQTCECENYLSRGVFKEYGDWSCIYLRIGYKEQSIKLLRSTLLRL